MLFVIITQLWTVPRVHYAVYNSYTTAVDCLSRCSDAAWINHETLMMVTGESGFLTTVGIWYVFSSLISRPIMHICYSLK